MKLWYLQRVGGRSGLPTRRPALKCQAEVRPVKPGQTKIDSKSLLVSPNPFQMRDAGAHGVDRRFRAQLKDLDVAGLNHRFERGKINIAAAGREMVAAGEFDVMNMKTGEPVGAFRQESGMIDEAHVVFDLRVPGVVPIIDGGSEELIQQ